MRAWVFMLSGLIVWAAHFAGIYAVVSVAEVIGGPGAKAPLWVSIAITLMCAAANIGLLMVAARRRLDDDGMDGLGRSLAGLGAAVSLAAVLWQGLPALFAA